MKKNFASRLRELRGDYSQDEFCGKIGAKQTTYSAWERGVSEPSHDVLRQMANIFCVSTDWLLGLTDSRSGTCDPAPNPEALAEIAELKAEVARLNAELVRVNGENVGLRYAFEAFGKGK